MRVIINIVGLLDVFDTIDWYKHDKLKCQKISFSVQHILSFFKLIPGVPDMFMVTSCLENQYLYTLIPGRLPIASISQKNPLW